jgi:hypothetical protein
MESPQIPWSEHIENWQASSISQAEYCRRNNLQQYKFSYWKRKLLEPPESNFVALETPSAPVFEFRIIEGWRFELRLTLSGRWTGNLF